MRIADILRSKGTTVATCEPGTTVASLVTALNAHNVGALVVMDQGGVVRGIVSERDVVRRLAEHGPSLLEQPVSTIMTATVITCGLEDTVDTLRELMTDNRVRHVPVIVDGELSGIVSIGDVVKSRISELENDRQHLESYIYR
ncbi:CBS domain-containing protein [Lipingzhangella sp. LS1_29]|uniref:CBS domain-containing protein n=1 Tax=Lipingzhangella rawalii TaxID=2055835 RepID=A0ABU2H8E2_9ACTN|nr:CBS domain-containing protein [Lipingzhangella rawalii]MDS1271262.1 CBS domain-containing protein [Lipingzhangella rawalii]